MRSYEGPSRALGYKESRVENIEKMSLTSFVARKEIREVIRENFTKPRIVTSKNLLAPPQTKRYSLVGTAFDYILRFHAQRLNQAAIERTWAATKGFSKLDSLNCFDVQPVFT